MKTTCNNIAIYGGAFNPPTKGHALVIEGLLTSDTVEKIIFSPDGVRADKKYPGTPELRKKILDIFFSELKEKFGNRIEMSHYFLEGGSGQATTSREIDTYFQELLGCSPYHIFGSDVAPDMPTWSNNENNFIEKKLKKIFIQRPGYDFSGEGMENYILTDIENLMKISSTTVREMIKNKIRIHDVLTPKVADYIDTKDISYNS